MAEPLLRMPVRYVRVQFLQAWPLPAALEKIQRNCVLMSTRRAEIRLERRGRKEASEMKKTLAMMILAAMTAIGSYAQSTPPFGPGNSGNPQQGAKGKKSGPQDGSGPIHQPGTGGGTGKGQRGPRR
jgi:hypothetical protein